MSCLSWRQEPSGDIVAPPMTSSVPGCVRAPSNERPKLVLFLAAHCCASITAATPAFRKQQQAAIFRISACGVSKKYEALSPFLWRTAIAGRFEQLMTNPRTDRCQTLGLANEFGVSAASDLRLTQVREMTCEMADTATSFTYELVQPTCDTIR